MEIEREIQILTAEKDEQGRFRLKIRNPVFLPVAIIVLTMIISFFYLAAKQAYDAYYPYEGEVVMIEKQWYDGFIFESNDDEHLILRTPEGDTIDRYINAFERVRSRIETGDFVIKHNGFNEKPRVKGKKTSEEMIKELENKIEE
ncbi:MAG TPA: hypothetical protein PKW56_04910 [Clostridiales bacterium]|nr:hypothetical protein [Clostridiales bacterium]